MREHLWARLRRGGRRPPLPVRTAAPVTPRVWQTAEEISAELDRIEAANRFAAFGLLNQAFRLVPGLHRDALSVVVARARGRTLAEIGESLWLTRQRVHQIERETLAAFGLPADTCAAIAGEKADRPSKVEDSWDEEFAALFRHTGKPNRNQVQVLRDMWADRPGNEWLADHGG